LPARHKLVSLYCHRLSFGCRFFEKCFNCLNLATIPGLCLFVCDDLRMFGSGCYADALPIGGFEAVRFKWLEPGEGVYRHGERARPDQD